MDIELSTHFLKRAKKLSLEEKRKLSLRMDWFRENPDDSRLKTHALTGKLKGLFSFALTYSKRVIFIYLDKNKALFLDVGSHREVYRNV